MKKKRNCSKFGVPDSTLSAIIKNREAVEHRFLNNKKAEKSRKCTFPDMDEYVKKWFTQCRDQGIPISRQMMQRKAEDFAKELGRGEHFKGSNGWLESFKNKHKIVFRKLFSESASVPESVCEEWIKDIPALVKGYEPKNILNADETGLFYQCLPDKTAMFKDEGVYSGTPGWVGRTSFPGNVRKSDVN
ncbi:Tigger transposable element-derived protein 4 [Araneus ventricosus]|uniref:Tigger transposable element-derived protein 4 n=1 Tax=Araneus ventricosus TaxID=182803 RepID=A0A4Y2BYL1_ARAVE|nr:Tigger transposable element-derived protein 4 [Araneus ventricosus]